MMKDDYHFELNPFVENVRNKLEMVDSKSEYFELEYKYAFLKHTKDNNAFKSSETSSLVRPIILNATKYQNKHKINAGCDREYYKNAQKNLKMISEIKDIDPTQRHMLYMNNGDQKFLYDCRYSQWMRVDKEKLFRRQFDLIYKKKLFRLDLSHKIFEEKNILDKVMAMLEIRKKNVGILRYKHSFIYEVHQFWIISCSTVYQTQNEQDFLGMKKLLAEFKEDIGDQIKKTIEQNQKKARNKFQFQLIFTQEGIDFLKVASESDAKSLISKAFNTFEELTNDSQVQQLQKLFDGLKLEQKQKKNQQIKSQLLKQETIASKKIYKVQKKEEEQDVPKSTK